MAAMNTTTPTRPAFKLSGHASIKHLNVRKEGPDDEKILAVDVKLEFKRIDRRLCAFFDESLEAFLWRGETDALIARNTYLAPVTYLNSVLGANVEIDGRQYHGVDVKKFSICPEDGGVITLGCTITVNPNSSDVSELARSVQDDVHVSIEAAPDLFAGGPDLAVDGAGNVTGAQSEIGDAESFAADVQSAFMRIQDTARDSGSTVSIEHEGKVLATFGDGPDPMYDQALAVVRKEGKASISLVQRRLKIGYNRAARLVEDMEKSGVVSPMSSSGERTLVKVH